MATEAGGESFQLPAQPEQAPEQSSEQARDKVIERQQPAAAEAGVGKRAPRPGSTTDVTQLPPVPSVADITLTDQPTPAVPKTAPTDDLTAADADLIEKEWIERAKSIVARTHDDPHRQKSEMSRVKADYIKKRFNKTIKTDETAVA